MSSRPRITITQTQRLRLNTGLQTSIRILRVDAAGLTRYLEEQAADNPHLRLDPPPLAAVDDWLPRWAPVFSGQTQRVEDVVEAPAPSLVGHVSSEIDRIFPPGRERQIALGLAEALEPSGWLGRSVKAIAADFGAGLREVEAVLRQLQKIEPAGLFARDLAECLALQLADLGELDPVMRQVLTHLDLLGSGALDRLARLCGTNVAEVTQRLRLIRRLDPKPGGQFGALAAVGRREPDLVLRRNPQSGWDVMLNRSSLPTLHILPVKTASPELLTAARALQKMVQARNSTLLRVGREILLRQVQALEQGPAALLPLTMAEVAQALELHESTVSRVVAGASVDTPRGTWWLRALFSTAVGVEGGPIVSAAALRDRLARLVSGEDPARPLSDEALAALLADNGPQVARRTVAKYRAMLQIAPAHRRKQRLRAATMAQGDLKRRSRE